MELRGRERAVRVKSIIVSVVGQDQLFPSCALWWERNIAEHASDDMRSDEAGREEWSDDRLLLERDLLLDERPGSVEESVRGRSERGSILRKMSG